MAFEWLICKAMAGKGTLACVPATKAALATKGAATSVALSKGAATSAALSKGTATSAALSKGAAVGKASPLSVSAMAALNKGAALTKATLSEQINQYAHVIFNWVSTNGIPLTTGATVGGTTVWQVEKRRHDREKEELTGELANVQGELQNAETKLQTTEEILLELAKLQSKPQVERPEGEAEPSEPVSQEPVPDDLKRIRGIGTVFSGRLNEAGIFTFAQLAETNPEEITEIVFLGNTVRNYDVVDWIAEARQLAGYDEETAPTADVAESDEQRTESEQQTVATAEVALSDEVAREGAETAKSDEQTAGTAKAAQRDEQTAESDEELEIRD